MSPHAAAPTVEEQPVTAGAINRWWHIIAGALLGVFVAGGMWATLGSRVDAVERKTDELTTARAADAAWRRHVDQSLALIICKLDPAHCDPRNP